MNTEVSSLDVIIYPNTIAHLTLAKITLLQGAGRGVFQGATGLDVAEPTRSPEQPTICT